MRIFTFFIYATILFFLSFIIVVPAMGFYQNDIKPLVNGYKKIEKSNLILIVNFYLYQMNYQQNNHDILSNLYDLPNYLI